MEATIPAPVTPGSLLPDVDVWLGAFSRTRPDPLIVHGFGHLVRQRRIVLVGWVRQTLLASAADERQAGRLGWVLSAWPDLPLLPADHEAAARRLRTQVGHPLRPSPWQALLWALCDRLNACIWSRDRSWSRLREQGCPVIHSPTGV